MTKSETTQPHVLLVEDVEHQAKLVMYHLRELDIDLGWAENGEHALAMIRDTQPQLILLDLQLPGIDGFEVCKRLKDNPITADIPIIFITASDNKQDKLQAFKSGAEDYVTKPFIGQELLVRVEGVMNRYRLIQSLKLQSRTDSLTGLPNREAFFNHIDVLIKKTHEIPGYRFAILFLDLDRFKLINDGLGHAAGDDLLNIIANRLKGTLENLPQKLRGSNDMLARIGGDEFTIILDEITEEHVAVMSGKRFIECLCSPIRLMGHEISLSASIGIRIADQHARDAVSLVREADAAMYDAKSRGAAQVSIFRDELHTSQLVKLEMENQLRKAIPENQLTLHYQPQVCLESGQINGFEALVRWNHPEKGYMPPGMFIPLAEESGLISQVGAWVLRQSCEDMVKWIKQFPDKEFDSICVNVSRFQLLDIEFPAIVESVLQDTGMPANQLQLEITESAAVDDLAIATHLLDHLRKIGIRIALDDFGLGYSALASLHRLPLDTLKIDRSFVNTAIENSAVSAILQAIITLADKLQLAAIAEGVESMDQLTQLQSLECPTAQGFFLSRPMPGDIIPSLIETWDPSSIPLKQSQTSINDQFNLTIRANNTLND